LTRFIRRSVARTVLPYIDEKLRRAAKEAAIRAGVKEYEVYEDALRKYFGWDALAEMLARHSDLSELPDPNPPVLTPVQLLEFVAGRCTIGV